MSNNKKLSAFLAKLPQKKDRWSNEDWQKISEFLDYPKADFSDVLPPDQLQISTYKAHAKKRTKHWRNGGIQ